jgi:hypothetical protein
MRCEADEQTSIRLRAGQVDEERLGLLDRHGPLWIGPPLLPLLVLIVWTIWDMPWQGPTATIAHRATAEAPAKLSERSSNGIGSAHERHSKRNVPSTRRRSSPLLEEISFIQPWQNAK